MSFKFVVLLAVVALAGQGLAWPRDVVAEQEKLPESAVSLFLGHSPFSLVSGVQRCISLGVQIVRELGNQVALFGRAKLSKMVLIGGVFKCLRSQDAAAVKECGVACFTQYAEEAKKIEDERIASSKILSELKKALPKCLEEDPAPTPPPTTEPPTPPPTTQPPTPPPTTQPPTPPPTTQPPTPSPTTQPPTPPPNT